MYIMQLFFYGCVLWLRRADYYLVLRGLPFQYSLPVLDLLLLSGIAVYQMELYASTLKDKLKEGMSCHMQFVLLIESLRPGYDSTGN